MDDNYDLLQDLEDGLFETPRNPGNDGSSASQWRQRQQQQSEQASSMFGLLGNTVRRISDQYQGAPRDPLGDLDEQEESSPPPPADEEEEAVRESKNEDDEQEQAQHDAYATEMHRLRLEIDALKRSNAVLSQQVSEVERSRSTCCHFAFIKVCACLRCPQQCTIRNTSLSL